MTRIHNLLAGCISVSVPLVSAIATYAPGGPSYSIGIPSGSAISQTSTGPIYIQLSAPVSYSWVGFGIGNQMNGATIFLVYADGKGNITAGVRKGTGHVQPLLDSTLTAGLTVLEGSGIVGGNMVANLKCTSCNLQSTSTSVASPWIAAWGQGNAIDSTSQTANINQHNPTDFRTTGIDLSQAAISTDSNPFVSSSSSSSSTTSSTTSTPTSGSSAATSTTSNGKSGNGVAFFGGFGGAYDIEDYQKAHGIIMGLVVVLLFPIGSIGMRLGGNMNIHRIIQILSLVALLVGFGLGIKLAQMIYCLFEGPGVTHTVFGTVIIVLFLFQPIFGIMHHSNFMKYGSRTPVSHVHIWYGRIVMFLAVINGGLGLQLAGNSPGGKIAYAVVSAAVGGAYAAAVVFRRKQGQAKEELNVVSRSEQGHVAEVANVEMSGPHELASEEMQSVGYKH